MSKEHDNHIMDKALKIDMKAKAAEYTAMVDRAMVDEMSREMQQMVTRVWSGCGGAEMREAVAGFSGVLQTALKMLQWQARTFAVKPDRRYAFCMEMGCSEILKHGECRRLPQDCIYSAMDYYRWEAGELGTDADIAASEPIGMDGPSDQNHKVGGSRT